MTITNVAGECQAPNCVCQNRRIQKFEKCYYIMHVSSKISHLFHADCMGLLACQDRNYLKTGRLSICPMCHERMGDQDEYSEPEAVAKIGFLYYVRMQNFDAAAELLATGLIPPILIRWAHTQPGFSERFPASHPPEQRARPANASAVLPSNPVGAAAASSAHSDSQNFKDRFQEAIFLYLNANPRATEREMQAYLQAITGRVFSLAEIQRLQNLR